MADDKSSKTSKTRRVIKKPVTLREKAEQQSQAKPKVRRLKQTASAAKRPVHVAKKIGQKEVNLPLPQNGRVGKFLNKKRRFTPGFLVNAWRELRQVQWPDRRTTARLTVAVFVFAIVFGAIITVVDFGLDKLFKKMFL